MNTRTKLAASGLLIAALAAAATPAFAAHSSTKSVGKLAGISRHDDRMGRHHGGPLAALVTSGTITQAKADAVETATRTAVKAVETAQLNSALAALVANNTITDALAEAAKATVANADGKHGHANLATWTPVQRTALHTWLQAHEPDRAAIAKAAVAKLVTDGTLTQAQANAVNAAFASMPERRDDGGRRHHGDGPGTHTMMRPTS